MNIDNIIIRFSKFLDASWDIVYVLLINRSYTTDESSVNDWLQANWEFLVERKLLEINQFLEPYGDEADFNGSSSRITDVNSLPTHYILVKGKENKKIQDLLNNQIVNCNELVFDKLVGFEKGFYEFKAPFKYVLVYDQIINIERVFNLNDVTFELNKL